MTRLRLQNSWSMRLSVRIGPEIREWVEDILSKATKHDLQCNNPGTVTCSPEHILGPLRNTMCLSNNTLGILHSQLLVVMQLGGTRLLVRQISRPLREVVTITIASSSNPQVVPQPL